MALTTITAGTTEWLAVFHQDPITL